MSDGLTGSGADSPSAGPDGLGAAMMMFCSALSVCRRSAADLRPTPVSARYTAHARRTSSVDSRQVIKADANAVVASSLRFNLPRSRDVDSSTGFFTQSLWALDGLMRLPPGISWLHPVFRSHRANL